MTGQAVAVLEFRQPSRFRAEAPTHPNPHHGLSVTLLGPFRVFGGDGADLLPRVRKTRAVLAILALAAPQPVPRAQIIALLWSRRDPPQARGSLRQAVLDLRLTLGPANVLLRAERGHLALSDDGLQVDARQVLLATSAQPAPLELWQGGLLSDLIGLDPAFDQWLDEQCKRLWQRIRTIGAMVLAGASGPDATIAAAERLLEIDAAHEDAWRALIRVQSERGDLAAAIAAYERCRTTLSAHYQIVPSDETTALVAALRTRPTPPTGLTQRSSGPAPRWGRRNAGARIRLGVATPRHGGASGAGELAAGLGGELIVALTRFRWLACVPFGSGHAHPDVDYLLDGSVQYSGDRLRVLLRLTDIHGGGEVVWAERFDHPITDLFALQDRLAGTTAARLEPRLWLWEGDRVGAGGIEPQSAQDLLRLAVPALHRLDRRKFLAAGSWLNQSVQLDPDNAAANAWAAQWHIFAVGQGWASDPAAAIDRAHDLADCAIRLDPEDARALTLAGHVRGFIDHRPQEALRLHERAIAANPNLPLSWCLSGLAHTYGGDCSAAIDQIRHAQALSPNDPLSYFFEMALAQANLLRGDPAAAAQAGLRAIALNSRFSSTYKPHLAALGHLHHTKGAAETRTALLALEPGFTVEEALRRSPITDPAGRALYAEGLRLGGLA
jgi:DNA-binding SARP family transcriptional activator/tetratricopeptide (TPR) repeat protein